MVCAPTPYAAPLYSLVFEHNYPALQAALDGLGVVIALLALIADESCQ
jgi:hypothetical protein